MPPAAALSAVPIAHFVGPLRNANTANGPLPKSCVYFDLEAGAMIK